MESLERLSSSLAQLELLLASLKRENRDLAGRLAAAAQERRLAESGLQELNRALEASRAEADSGAQIRSRAEEERAALERELESLRSGTASRIRALEEESAKAGAESAERIRALEVELERSRLERRVDPDLERRAHASELETADLARRLDFAQRQHLEEKGRLEALIRQLEAHLMAEHDQDQMPVASADTLASALDAQRRAEEALHGAQARSLSLEALIKEQQERLESLRGDKARLEAEAGALNAGLQAVKGRLAELEAEASRSTDMDARRGKLDQEREELKRQRRELAAFAKERNTLRRRVEELVSTLESVRL